MDKQKKFNSLEDIDKKLFQKRDEGSSKKKIKTKRQTAMYVENPLTDFLRDYSRLLVIPAAVVVLTAGIMIAEALSGGGGSGESEPVRIATASVAPAYQGEALAAAAEETETGLKENEDTRIERLINEYFYSRLNADVDSLYAIFGRTVDTDRDELQRRLDAERSWIQSYDGIKVYVLPGLSEGERLAVVTYRINFRRTDTMAPGIMYCYISEKEDGSLYIEENLLKDKVDFINEELERPEIKELIDTTDSELRAALESDSDLALIYTSFNNGEIYMEQDLDVNREQEVAIMFTPEGSDLTDAKGSEGAAETEAVEETPSVEIGDFETEEAE